MMEALARVDAAQLAQWLAAWLAQELAAEGAAGADSAPASPLASPLLGSTPPPPAELAFQASRPPAIGIPPYLGRLLTYADPGLEAFLMLPTLVARLKQVRRRRRRRSRGVDCAAEPWPGRPVAHVALDVQPTQEALRREA